MVHAMTRRQLLAGASTLAAQTPPPHPIVDTHIHLFDPTRPEGVPWPPKSNATLYKPALPERYRQIAVPLGITAAIEVECSPWLEDNQWVLDVAAKDKIMVGMIGNLEPGKPAFRKHLDRFHKNPLFLGIRYGNLWDRDFHAELAKPQFLEGVKALAAAGLTLDTANPCPNLISDLVRLTDRAPELRLVIDHLPQLEPPADPQARQAYIGDLHELAKRPQVFVKISEVFRKVDGKIPEDPAFYKPRLDELYGIFGPDRLVYGSDWPNSDNWVEYAKVLALVRGYFGAKGPGVSAKYFYENSRLAYRWPPRAA